MKLSTLIMSCFIFTLTSCDTVKTFVDNNIVKVLKTTAYTHTEADHTRYKKKAATGETLVANHSAAADWSIFPVGTVLRIDNHKYEISDYGSALVKRSGEIPVVDIYQPSRYAMNKYGSKYVNNVEVVKWGSYQESAEILRARLNYPHCRTMYNRIQTKL
jgi:3D (Asp-Asp-Asp) domain-containing protein